MKRKLIVLLFIFTFASSCAIAERKTVKVGYYKDSAPFMNGNSEKDPKGGYCYEYLQYIASFTGWKYEYVYGGFGDLYQKFLDGEIDLLAGLAYREERKDIIKMYLPASQIRKYDFLRVVTFAWLRTLISSNKVTAVPYNALKNFIYRFRGKKN